MALAGRLHQETYLRTRRRKQQNPFRFGERKRITAIDKLDNKGHKRILSATYVEGTRKAKRLELYSGKELAIIELQADKSYTITRMHPVVETKKVIGLQFNQRTGTLTWFEVEQDGTTSTQQKLTIESRLLSRAALLLFFPIGWFLLPFRQQLDSISDSWNSLADAFEDAYSER